MQKNTIETWERQKGEYSRNFSAFCTFRDDGPERSIIKVIRSIEQDEKVVKRKYRAWRRLAARFQWTKRATDYDDYLDKVNLAEQRDSLKKRKEAYLQAAAKVLNVVINKLDVMSKEELSQNNVMDWLRTALKTEMEMLGLGKEEAMGSQLVKFDPSFEELCENKEEE